MNPNADKLARVNRGEKFRPKASTHNALMDMLRRWRSMGLQLGGAAGDLAVQPAVTVEVQNTCGSDLDEFAILKVNATPIAVTDNARAFKDGRMLTGVTPTASSNFVVLQRPIAANKFGPAAILGLTPVQINVTDAAHTHATVGTSTTELTSGTSGPAAIIAKESGTGTKWALVNLSGQGGSAALASTFVQKTATQTLSGAGTTRVVWDDTAVYDELGVWSAANDYFDIAVTGKYLVTAGFRLEDLLIDVWTNCMIKVVAETPPRAAQAGDNDTGTATIVHNMSYQGLFTAGDKIEVAISKIAASDVNIVTGAAGVPIPYFAIARLS